MDESRDQRVRTLAEQLLRRGLVATMASAKLMAESMVATERAVQRKYEERKQNATLRPLSPLPEIDKARRDAAPYIAKVQAQLAPKQAPIAPAAPVPVVPSASIAETPAPVPATPEPAVWIHVTPPVTPSVPEAPVESAADSASDSPAPVPEKAESAELLVPEIASVPMVSEEPKVLLPESLRAFASQPLSEMQPPQAQHAPIGLEVYEIEEKRAVELASAPLVTHETTTPAQDAGESLLDLIDSAPKVEIYHSDEAPNETLIEARPVDVPQPETVETDVVEPTEPVAKSPLSEQDFIMVDDVPSASSADSQGTSELAQEPAEQAAQQAAQPPAETPEPAAAPEKPRNDLAKKHGIDLSKIFGYKG